ncbi:MAG: hypothetical protein AAGN66_15805 [Acidobacteriota bacterium]
MAEDPFPGHRGPVSRRVSGRLLRFELVVLGCFAAAWLGAILAMVGWLPVAGRLDLDLYRYYSVAAVLGWLTGNVFVFRRNALPAGPLRLRILLTYLVMPPGLLYLLRAMAPSAAQAAAPFVPLYGSCVYGLFFLVPLTLRATRTPRRR